MDKVNLSNLRQRFGGAVYNWKVHEIAAEDLEKCISISRISNIVMTTATITVLILPQVITWEYTNNIALVLGVIQIVFLITQLYFSFDEKKSSHKKSALEFQNLRNEYINLMTDLINNLDPESIIKRRDALNDKYRVICGFSLHTSEPQYQRTRKKLNVTPLKDGEDFTLSENEIDHFLTNDLKYSTLFPS